MWILGLKGLNQTSRYVLDSWPATRRRISGRRLERSDDRKYGCGSQATTRQIKQSFESLIQLLK